MSHSSFAGKRAARRRAVMVLAPVPWIAACALWALSLLVRGAAEQHERNETDWYRCREETLGMRSLRERLPKLWARADTKKQLSWRLASRNTTFYTLFELVSTQALLPVDSSPLWHGLLSQMRTVVHMEMGFVWGEWFYPESLVVDEVQRIKRYCRRGHKTSMTCKT